MALNNIDFNSLVLEENRPAYLADMSLNVHISMPCPLKVPFRQLFTPIVEEYNANHPELPLHCPNITDCSSTDIEDILRTAKSENDLPDLIITTNFRILMANGFYERFVKNHIYEGVVNKKHPGEIPTLVKNNLLENNIGVWCFSSWSFVQDLTVEKPGKPIVSWKQIASTDLEGKITVHGHVDKATFSVAYFIQKQFGETALAQYARNIADIKHFSQAIKRLNSSDPNKTLLTMLPDVAIANIPSNKKVKVLDLEEGKVLSPMILMVKRSKLEACNELLEILWSKPFESLLSEAGGILPHLLSPDKNYFIPDFREISHQFEKVEAEVDRIYMQHLPWASIESKITEGGVCK
jgi:hypothetical protein